MGAECRRTGPRPRSGTGGLRQRGTGSRSTTSAASGMRTAEGALRSFRCGWREKRLAEVQMDVRPAESQKAATGKKRPVMVRTTDGKGGCELQCREE